ncbi:MAG: hypothetical protein IJU45_00650 [Clostridia bacterium]|nr:hypothetical protein [Clostridia bacterium]
MDGEVLFRKSVFGGFNREDVMQYIDQLSAEKNALESATQKLESTEKELEDKNAEVEKLTEKIEELEAQIAENRQKEEKAQSVKAGFDTTADKLMRDSMAYAQQYVDSAELMAKNIREDVIEKVSDADSKVTGMLDSMDELIVKAQDFDAALRVFKADFEEIQKSFEEEKKSE